MKCGIDYETYSEIDLKKHGLSVYARHKSTEILCMAFKVEGQDTKLWLPGQPLPISIDSVELSAQNAPFEFAIWNWVGVKKYGFPPLPLEKLTCTLAMALTHSLPGSLEKMAPALGIETVKDMAGNRIMLQLSKPRKVNEDGSVIRWTVQDAPEKFEALYSYCITDVEVEDACKNRMNPLTERERQVWLLDQKINMRGIQIDIPNVKKAIEIIEGEKIRLDNEMRRISDYEISSIGAVAQIKTFCSKHGVEINSVGKEDLKKILDGELPKVVREVLEIRQEAAKSSTAKLQTMIDRADEDGRVRYTLQYHGASTGRWSGRGIQLQNLPRPSLKQDEIEKAIKFLSWGAEYIDMFFGPPMSVISDCIRSFIIAKEDHDLMVADFAAIEGRVLAWLAGQESSLDVYRSHGKKYEAAAADIYGVNINDVTKEQRQIGKVAELALGFQGGVGAFQSMAKVYGLHVPDSQAESIKHAWRKANPFIVKYWYALEEAALNAVMNPGQIFKAGAKRREVSYKVSGSFLMCRLPSTRVLYYPYPKVEPGKFGKDQVTYMSENSVTKKWSKHHLYGGLASENITQAVARDILAEALIRAEDNGYQIVSHVHDEIIAEIPKTFGTVENFINILTTLPSWANGLPLAAEGYRSARYRK